MSEEWVNEGQVNIFCLSNFVHLPSDGSCIRLIDSYVLLIG